MLIGEGAYSYIQQHSHDLRKFSHADLCCFYGGDIILFKRHLLLPHSQRPSPCRRQYMEISCKSADIHVLPCYNFFRNQPFSRLMSQLWLVHNDFLNLFPFHPMCRWNAFLGYLQEDYYYLDYHLLQKLM